MVTRNSFLEQLEQLRHDILTMATRVEENLGKALIALHTCNVEMAKEVRVDDLMVDALQLKIEDEAAIVIATQQPVAGDLRELVAIFKLASNIERVGDHAAHLAKAAKRLSKAGDIILAAQEGHLERMAETGQKMMHNAISAFLEQDADAARKAAAMDKEIDMDHKTLSGNILKLIKKNPDIAKGAFQVLQTSDQLERLGDHITNICEAIIYMIEGKHEELNE